jgi:hypothetical protein
VWASQFDVDGLDVTNGLPETPIAGPNQILADRMGIVMGTSHQEPMARNTPEWSQYGEGDWNFTKNTEMLHDFWVYGAERAKGYETMFTVGMRGNGDLPLPGANVPIMESESIPQSGKFMLMIRYYGCSARYPQDGIWYSGYIVNTTSLGNVQGGHGVLCRWHDCP